MEQLGIGPSRDVGRARDFLLELRLEEGPLGEDEARRRLAAWWKAQPPPTGDVPGRQDALDRHQFEWWRRNPLQPVTFPGARTPSTVTGSSRTPSNR